MLPPAGCEAPLTMRERERERGGGREGERERACVCVCVCVFDKHETSHQDPADVGQQAHSSHAIQRVRTPISRTPNSTLEPDLGAMINPAKTSSLHPNSFTLPLKPPHPELSTCHPKSSTLPLKPETVFWNIYANFLEYMRQLAT